jgi:type I restriction enzyme S subunit
MGEPPGDVAIYPLSEEGIITADCIKVTPHPSVNVRYLLYALSAPDAKRQIIQITQGVAQSKMSLARFRHGVQVPLAPSSEQDRIVAAIEEQFSRLDAGIASLEQARKNLKRMRTAVLQAAVNGRLVSAERALPVRPLGEALSFLDQGWSPRCENVASEDEHEWAVIKTTAVQAMTFDEHANKKLPHTLQPRPKYELMPGDLLITRAGPRARAGVCCLVRNVRKRLMICDKVYRFRAYPELALPEYLELVLNAPSMTRRIDELKTGISDSGVNITQQTFRELEITLPDLDTQAQIVSDAECLLTSLNALEAYVAATMARTYNLRSSILTAAFSGKLAPQDAADEPASVLLERIEAEQAASNSHKLMRGRMPRTLRGKVTS